MTCFSTKYISSSQLAHHCKAKPWLWKQRSSAEASTDLETKRYVNELKFNISTFGWECPQGWGTQPEGLLGFMALTLWMHLVTTQSLRLILSPQWSQTYRQRSRVIKMRIYCCAGFGQFMLLFSLSMLICKTDVASSLSCCEDPSKQIWNT